MKNDTKWMMLALNEAKLAQDQGEIPVGCIAQLMTELNGDNSVASVYLNKNTLRGCIDANIPYPGGNEEEVSYTIEKELDKHQYRLKVCQKVDGSMGGYCDKIIVQFSNRDYVKQGFDLKNVLVLDKLGEWD